MIFSATKQANVRALVASGWVGISLFPRFNLQPIEVLVCSRVVLVASRSHLMYSFSTTSLTTGYLTREEYQLSCITAVLAQQLSALSMDARLWSFHSSAIKLSGVRRLSAVEVQHSMFVVSVGSMIHKTGAGPKPIPHKELRMENLRDAITFATSANAVAAAATIAERIRNEVSDR